MRLIRLLCLLLLSTPLCTRAGPAFWLSETWSELAFFGVGGSTIVPMYTNGTASIAFSGLKMTNAGPITSSTQFSFLIGNFYITAPLSGDYSDPNNPIVSSYRPGNTNATLQFYHNHGGGYSSEMKTLRISWARNILSGSISGPTGTFGFQSFMDPPSSVVSSTNCFFGFGNYNGKLRYDYKYTNNFAISGGFVSIYGSMTGTGRLNSPTITITSPAPNVSTINPIVQIAGVNTAFNGTGVTMWRWAAPTDDPSLDVDAFSWNVVDNPGSLQAKRTLWSTSADMSQLGPGTNWFWAATSDSILNPSAIVMRKFFYSVRSPLTLSTSGTGTVTGSREVTNGATLEVGRGYTVTGKPKGTNIIFRDWRDGSSTVLATVNPWNFLMQSNMTIVGNFVTNPFPAIAGTYSGSFSDTFRPPLHNNPSPANSGYTIVTVKPDGTYTGTVLFGGGRFPIAGKLSFDTDIDDADAVNATFVIAADQSLSGNIRFPSDGSGHLLPTPMLSMTISSLILPPMPLVQSSTNAVAPGLYNFVDNVANLSVGASYGSVVVTPRGQANVVIHLADGSPAVSFSTPVRKDHSIAIFIPLNHGDGMILATLNLEFLFPFHASGGRWVKPTNARAKVYPAGLVENLDLVIGRYTPNIGKSILTNFGVGEIMIANDTISYSAQFLYSPANNQIVAMPGQTNVTMNLTFDPATGLVGGTITFVGHSPFHINALIGGENIGYTLDTDHSVLVLLRATALSSLGTYDDGFVLVDENSTDARLGTTTYFSFQHAWQLLTIPAPPMIPSLVTVISGPPTIAVQMLLHRDIQVAPQQHIIFTDTFDSMDLHYSGLYPALPSVGPYTGPNNPADYAAPAVTITPTHRATQYIGY